MGVGSIPPSLPLLLLLLILFLVRLDQSKILRLQRARRYLHLLGYAQVLVRADVENADARGLVLRGRVLALSVHFGGFSEAWGRRNVHDLV